MTKHDRQYLQVQAKAAVDKAIAEPGTAYGLNYDGATVVRSELTGNLKLRLSADTYCEFDVADRAELEAMLVDDWQLQQGDEGE
jgi:hypothetical protein